MATVELNSKPYTISGTVSREVIQTFAPPVRTIGQQGRADVVPYSQWVIGDVTEGVGVLDGRYPGDEKRIWDSGLQTHFKSGWSLPPRKIQTTRSGGVSLDAPQFFFSAGGVSYMLTLRQDPGNVDGVIGSVYEYAISTTTWTLKASATEDLTGNGSAASSTSATGGGREGARLGRPAYWGGSIWAPCGPMHSNLKGANDLHRSYLLRYEIETATAAFVEFDLTTDGSSDTAPDISNAATQQPLALIQHRGNLIALAFKPDTNKLTLFKSTAVAPTAEANWTLHMTWQGNPEKDGATHLLRPFTPCWLEEGLDQDGNVQLYVMVGGTVWRVDFSGGVVAVFLESNSTFVVATGAASQPDYIPLAPEAPMVWWQNGLVTTDQDGRVYHSSPQGVHTLIGLTRDDGPAVSGVELFRGFEVVADLLLAATRSRAMIFNQKGWSTLHDSKAAEDLYTRVYWDGTHLHLGQEALATARQDNVLDINDLDRVVKVGGRTFDDVVSGVNTELETSRFDGGFPERPGLAYRINIRADDVTANETVKIEFQTDAAAYATAGTMSTGKTATFDLGAGGIGIPFKWIQLRVTLDRGGTNTLSPFVISIIVDYDKLEKVLERFEFVIDATTSRSQGRSVRDVATEITNITGENAEALVPFKWGHINTNVRVTRVGGAAASLAQIGQRADFQETHALIAVTVEER